eukprot:5012250-Heterocapsa_arctica.AAC.1
MVHGMRNTMRLFAKADGVCPSCGIQLHTRIRLITHLSDKRRDKCRNYVTEHAFPMSDDEAKVLDVIDQSLLAHAKKDGHSHVIANKPAFTGDGKRIGFCTG